MNKSKWYYLGYASGELGKLIIIFIVVTILISLLGAFNEWRFKRGLRNNCVRPVELLTGNGRIPITDPRPIYICNI